MYKLLFVLSVPAVYVCAQTGPAPSDAVAQQRSAVAAMQDSLAAQQASIQKQTNAQASNGSFFAAPRAATLGVNAAMPAPLASSSPMPPAADCAPLASTEVDSLVGQTAERDGLSADLLRSVMKQESGFRPCAVSPKGALGLMQLMPATAGQFGVQNPFDAA